MENNPELTTMNQIDINPLFYPSGWYSPKLRIIFMVVPYKSHFSLTYASNNASTSPTFPGKTT